MTTSNCDLLSSMLDDLIEGTLDGSTTETALAHLETCEDCRSELEAAKILRSATLSLPTEIEPETDLWPGIRSRIEQRRVVRGSFDHRPVPASRRLWMSAAAAAILVVAVSVAYMAGLNRARVQTAAAVPVVSDVVPAAYVGSAMDLELARNQLRASLESRRDQLSSETWSVVMENMAVIDDAIARIEHALAANPNDARLNRQLASAYRRQIDLLQRAARLPAEA
jgi:anti-sigma-K factor RskA